MDSLSYSGSVVDEFSNYGDLFCPQLKQKSPWICYRFDSHLWLCNKNAFINSSVNSSGVCRAIHHHQLTENHDFSETKLK